MKLHKSGHLWGGVLCLLLSVCMAGRAQESLLIGPGDQLTVSFFDAPELNQVGRVSDSGDFPLLMGGNIKLAGLTPERANATIASYMSSAHYLVNPRVSVVVTTYAAQNISVLGEVRVPGAYPTTVGKTLSEVLALAGGLLPTADRHVVVQRRVTGELFSFYSSNSPLTTPDSSAPGLNTAGPGTAGANTAGTQPLQSRDVMIYPGDLVRVPRADLVYVLGDVGRPGGYPIVNNDQSLTILQLIALAGATPPSAWPSKTRLIRKLPDGKYDDIPIQLSAMQKGKQPDRTLQAGDIVYVPFSYLKNAALGVGGLIISAANAGIYRIP